MRVHTTCRNFRLTPSLKRQLEDRLSKLERFSFVREAHVVLAVQKFRHQADFVLKTNDKEIIAREESKDMSVSIDAAADHLERMLKKVKEKRSTRLLHDGTRTNGDETKGAVRAAARVALGTSAGLGADGRKARAANAALEDEDEAVDRGPALVPDTARLRKLTPEEAGAVLLAGDGEFLAFVNAETDEMNVIHRRKDGRLGWVAPAGRRRPRG